MSIQQNGTGGGPKPEGPTTDRHAPALFNVAYLPAYYWDGRASSLEEVVQTELSKRVAEGKLGERAAALAKVPGYAAQFSSIFSEKTTPSAAVVTALEAYLRTLTCGDTPFDRFQAGDQSAMTLQHQRGWETFNGKAKCVTCHAPPFFSDAYGDAPSFHNTGVATVDRSEDNMDPGRAAVTKEDADKGAFRTPSLRNVTKTGPYFHDGSMPTVDGAVIFDARGGVKNPRLSKSLKDRKLSPAELQSVIDFMGALVCDTTVSAPPLPPGE